jgi:hypothetical protein
LLIGIWNFSSSRIDPFPVAVQGHPRSIVWSNWSIPIDLWLLLPRPITIELVESLLRSVSVHLMLMLMRKRLTRPYSPVPLLNHISVMHFLCRILRIISLLLLLLGRIFILASVSVSPVFAFFGLVSNFAAN